MTRLTKALPLVSLVLLNGCANLTSPARHHEIDSTKTIWLDYDASRRGALITPNNKKLKTCSEPSPDVALTLISKLEATIKDKSGLDATAKAEFNASVVELGKRTQMVMFLREALFRLCEQSLNNDFSKTEILDSYNKVIAAAIDIVEKDKLDAKAKASEAETKATEAKNILKALEIKQLNLESK
jgi:hypothetical protein